MPYTATDWEALVRRQENRLYRAALAILGSAPEAEDTGMTTSETMLERSSTTL